MSATFQAVKGNQGVDLPFEINVSNANAAAILGALGFDTEFWESPPINAGEFHNACRDFIANTDLQEIVDGGQESVVEGNMIDCGRRAGYFLEKVTDLKNLTVVAMEKGATIVYFN